MKRLLPCAIVAALLAAGPVRGAPAPATEGDAATAVLDCHAQYARRYATHVDAAPSEIAAGAFAACHEPMAAYEALVPALAKKDARVAIGVGDVHATECEIIERFREDVRNATIDAVIRNRAK
jgi:hypothetical protein